MKVAFPGFESRKQREKEDMRKQLKEWTDSGPLSVVPLEEPKLKSRMRTKMVQVTKDERAQQFYRKLRNQG